MDNHQPLSYRDTRSTNAASNRYFTLVLSKQTLEDPLPIHCLFCGYTMFEANALPAAVIEGKFLSTDLKDRSIDVRCKKCKVTCRIT